jgi:hypothetical protein
MAVSEQSLSALLAAGIGSKQNHVNLRQGRHWLLAEFLSGIVDVLVLEIESTYMLETKGFTALFFETLPEVKTQFEAADELGFLELGDSFGVEVKRRNVKRPGLVVLAVSRVSSGWGAKKDRIQSEDGSLLPVSHFDADAITRAFDSALTKVTDYMKSHGYTRKPVIACPRICQGVGGALWLDVQAALNRAFDGTGYTLEAYVPNDPDARVTVGKNK